MLWLFNASNQCLFYKITLLSFCRSKIACCEVMTISQPRSWIVGAIPEEALHNLAFDAIPSLSLIIMSKWSNRNARLLQSVLGDFWV